MAGALQLHESNLRIIVVRRSAMLIGNRLGDLGNSTNPRRYPLRVLSALSALSAAVKQGPVLETEIQSRNCVDPGWTSASGPTVGPSSSGVCNFR